MTVSEVIRMLSHLPGDAIVRTNTSDGWDAPVNGYVEHAGFVDLTCDEGPEE